MSMISPSRSAVTWSIALACCFAIFIGALRASGPIRSVAVRSILAATDHLPPSDERGRTNVLLLGIGDKGHTAKNLTDAILIASIDPKDRTMLLFSIPRDLFIDPADLPAGKINSVYAYERLKQKRSGKTETGASLAAMNLFGSELEERMGIPIHGIVKMDFTGFEQVIDAVGGVDVDVSEELTDDTYPISEGVIGTFSLSEGPQHLDGVTALRYARSRHSTSDFDRSDRQQQILTALAKKARSLWFLTDSDAVAVVVDYVRGHMETTLTEKELFGLLGLAASIPHDRIIRAHLNDYAGGDYADAKKGGFLRTDGGTGTTLFPVSQKSDPTDWSSLRAFVSLLHSQREIVLRKNPVIVRSAGAPAKEPHRLRNELVRYGFIASEEKTGASDDVSAIEFSRASDKETAVFLSTLLMLPLRHVNRDGDEIAILLGKDFRYVWFVQLLETGKEKYIVEFFTKERKRL